MKELVGERIISTSNSCRVVKRWYRGWHPEMGKLINGWSGKETEVDMVEIRPIKTFMVSDEQGRIPSKQD